MESVGHENHQQEGRGVGSGRQGGNSAREATAAYGEANDTEDTVVKLSFGSQDTSRPTPISRTAKSKGKARLSPRAGHTKDETQSSNVEGVKCTLTKRDNPPKRRASAATLIGRPRPETRRVRSRDNLRRIHSANALRPPRGGQVLTKIHEIEQSAETQPGPSDGPINES